MRAQEPTIDGPEQSRARRSVSVCVVIVSYHTANLVISSLGALHRERERQHLRGFTLRVVVVDNASGDAVSIRAAISRERWGTWVDLVVSEKNGGFAYGNNLGFRHAYASGDRPDYFFLLNPDAEVRPDAIGVLVDFFERHPEAGCAGCSLEGRRGNLWPYAFRFPGILGEALAALQVSALERAFPSHVVLRRMGDDPEQVDWFPGAAMMLRSSIIGELGGMDEGYFLYYEETDFCLKLKRAGWTNWYVPASRVVHIAGQSSGITGCHGAERRLPQYWFESRRRYYVKNFGVSYAMATDVLAFVAHTLGMVKRELLGRPREQHPHFLRDLWRNSTLIPANRAIGPATEFRPSAHAG